MKKIAINCVTVNAHNETCGMCRFEVVNYKKVLAYSCLLFNRNLKYCSALSDVLRLKKCQDAEVKE